MTRPASFSIVAALALTAAAPAIAPAQTKIVIDPGHGGGDPGGTGNGLQEKDVVLDVGTRFKQLLDADSGDPGGGGDWIALMTREDDTFVSLSARAAFANAEGADRFMSIHSNAFGSSSANGTETFSFAEGTTGAAMRNLVQEEMLAAWGLTDRGNKVANFAVLRETAMPAELHELAFITNANDASFLASPVERQIAAEAHLFAIQRHFGIDPFLAAGGENTGQVAGRVVDDEGEPIAGAQVGLDDRKEVVTPDDGRFAFVQVAAGTHTLTVSAKGYDDAVVDVEVGVGELSETVVELSPGHDGDSDRGASGDDDDEVEATGREGGESGCGCAMPASRGGTGGWIVVVMGVAAVVLRRRRGRGRG